MNAGQFFGAMFGPLRRLFDFSGRSTRAELWPFVFLIFVISQLAMIIAMQGIFENFSAAVQQSAASSKGDIVDTIEPTEFASFFKFFFLTSAGSALLAVLLLAAVVTRRLHDTDRKGWWALPSAVLQLSGFWLMSRAFSAFGSIGEGGDESEAVGAILPAFANNFVYIASIIMLIVFCAQDGTVGKNRFGSDPKKRDPNTSSQSKPF